VSRTFIVYMKKNCGFCDRAKALLTSKGEEFFTKNVMDDASALFFLKEQGFKSVPQIWVKEAGKPERHIGGFTELDAYFKGAAE
jgi:glutaredoxin